MDRQPVAWPRIIDIAVMLGGVAIALRYIAGYGYPLWQRVGLGLVVCAAAAAVLWVRWRLRRDQAA